MHSLQWTNKTKILKRIPSRLNLDISTGSEQVLNSSRSGLGFIYNPNLGRRIPEIKDKRYFSVAPEHPTDLAGQATRGQRVRPSRGQDEYTFRFANTHIKL